jgi:hypothetical protein
MAAKPVVDGIEKQIGAKVRIVRVDVSTPEGRKVSAEVGPGMVPTFIGFDAQGNERWRVNHMLSRPELWRRVLAL